MWIKYTSPMDGMGLFHQKFPGIKYAGILNPFYGYFGTGFVPYISHIHTSHMGGRYLHVTYTGNVWWLFAECLEMTYLLRWCRTSHVFVDGILEPKYDSRHEQFKLGRIQSLSSSPSSRYSWNQGSIVTWYICNLELGSKYIGNWKIRVMYDLGDFTILRTLETNFTKNELSCIPYT